MPKMLVRHPKADYNLPKAEQVRVMIGERVRELRGRFNMSQKELAENLGKSSAAYIAFIESGERNMTAAELVRLCHHFKINISFFQK